MKDGEEIKKLCKEMRKRLFSLKTDKLTTLDYGDKKDVCEMLKQINGCLGYLNHLQNARCSVVLEACKIHPPKLTVPGRTT